MKFKDQSEEVSFFDAKLIPLFVGAFGEVVKARHLFSNEYRAIKIIEKKKLQKHSILMQL